MNKLKPIVIAHVSEHNDRQHLANLLKSMGVMDACIETKSTLTLSAKVVNFMTEDEVHRYFLEQVIHLN